MSTASTRRQPSVAQQCRARGACVDVLNADPYAWESNARAVVVARAHGHEYRDRSAGSTTTRYDRPLFMDAMPRGGVSSNSGLAGLAALVDEGEPKRRRIGRVGGPRSAWPLAPAPPRRRRHRPTAREVRTGQSGRVATSMVLASRAGFSRQLLASACPYSHRLIALDSARWDNLSFICTRQRERGRRTGTLEDQVSKACEECSCH